MPRAGIALGSNLGDRSAHIRAAVGLLAEIAVPGEPVLEAPVYQTEPRCCPPGSPDFHNTVVEIAFAGAPMDLLAQTRAIETKLGRVRPIERNAPRIIDVDILYLGEEIVENDDLMLPHPRIRERRFVLQPLADIRPDLRLPGRNLTIKEMLRALHGDEAPMIRVPMRS
ncbi:MAG: 2-amino-4-hydroxy-6-hydroxymethyldihydropteridine diphosphokinase [Luteolibacter sp.]|nr:2-amino-4-hydroxy-6-hydroxymethyldihydropteridine diphosphokinase [Luteolibacter sp.]